MCVLHGEWESECGEGWGGVYGWRISMSAEYKMVLEYSGWWMDITCTCITKMARYIDPWGEWDVDGRSNDSKQDSVKRWKYDVQESHCTCCVPVLARLLVPSCCFVYLDTSFFLSVSEMRIALKYMCGSRGYYNFQEVKIPKTTRRTLHLSWCQSSYLFPWWSGSWLLLTEIILYCFILADR
jgi:hypothetical protein